MHPAKAIYQSIIRNVTGITYKGKPVTVYSGIIPKDVTGPYIYMEQVTCNRADNKDSEIWQCELSLKIITKHQGNSGSESDALDIEEQLFDVCKNFKADNYSTIIARVLRSEGLMEVLDTEVISGRNLVLTFEIE